MHEPTEYCIPARLEDVRTLAEWVRQEAEKTGLSPELLIDLELALVEAANNIVIHGYRGAKGEIACSIESSRDSLAVTLRDWGSPMPDEKFDGSALPDAGQDHGRGLAIIRACIDNVRYESSRGENRLTLVKKRAS